VRLKWRVLCHYLSACQQFFGMNFNGLPDFRC